MAKLLDNIGAGYSAMGDLDEAMKWYTKSLEMKQTVYGQQTSTQTSNPNTNDTKQQPDASFMEGHHIEIGATLNGMAMIHAQNSRFAEALQTWSRAERHTREGGSLTSTDNENGNNHPNLITILENMANLHTQAGNDEEALPCYNEVLRLVTIHDPHNAGTIGRLYLSIGDCQYGLALHAMAKHAYEDGLDAIQPPRTDFGITAGNINEQTQTPTNGVTPLEQTDRESMQAIFHHSLGLTCGHLGMHDKALQHYQKSLLLKLKVLDNSHHEEIGDTYNHMGVTCSSLGKHHQGMEYCREALRIYELTLGDSNGSKINDGMISKVLDSVGRILPATEHPKILHVKKTLQLLEASGSGI